MPYQVELSKSASKELKKLPTTIQPRILEALQELAENPRPFGYIQMKGEENYRIRVGNYRILYDIVDDVLLVVGFSHSTPQRRI